MCEWHSELFPDYVCSAPRERGSRLCIFHKEEKDETAFIKTFSDWIAWKAASGEPLDMTGFVFPGSIATSETAGQAHIPIEYEADVILSSARIGGSAAFDGLQLKGSLFLDHCVVHGTVFLAESLIGGDLVLRSAIVEGNLHAGGARMTGPPWSVHF